MLLRRRCRGAVFDGDRRHDLVVRLPEPVRAQCRRACAELPIPLPARRTACARWEKSRISNWRRGPTRSTARTASAAWWSRPTCGAATWVHSSRTSAARGSLPKPSLPAWLLGGYGGTFEQLQSASARLAIVVPVSAGADPSACSGWRSARCACAIDLHRRAAGAHRGRRRAVAARTFRCRSRPVSGSSRCRALPCSTAWCMVSFVRDLQPGACLEDAIRKAR
jgi:hypothetical protein